MKQVLAEALGVDIAQLRVGKEELNDDSVA
jgi:hypothetical protein